MNSEKSGLGRQEEGDRSGGKSRRWWEGGRWVGSGLTLNSKGHFLERCEMSNKCISGLTREL